MQYETRMKEVIMKPLLSFVVGVLILVVGDAMASSVHAQVRQWNDGSITIYEPGWPDAGRTEIRGDSYTRWGADGTIKDVGRVDRGLRYEPLEPSNLPNYSAPQWWERDPTRPPDPRRPSTSPPGWWEERDR
jgi:hypothetical protein